jgi:hypothetical protein
MANVYAIVGKKPEACKTFDNSLAVYNEAKERDPSARIPFN